MTPDEQGLLRLKRLFSEMIETEAWREYVKIVEAQMEDRRMLVFSPIHDLPGDDMQSKFMALESIKGALIGLRLAITIPSCTITDAESVVRKEEVEENA